MSALALTFVLIAAFTHATWNFAAKRSGGGLPFVVSGTIKTGYALLLQRGYRHGDFSLIYPLARGTGPLLSTLAAIALFGERPSGLALAGGALIVGSAFYLTRGPAVWHTDRAHLRTGLLYGLSCGCCIAAYTVWDQHAVSHHALPPVIYDCGTQLVMCSILTPFAWPRR